MAFVVYCQSDSAAPPVFLRLGVSGSAGPVFYLGSVPIPMLADCGALDQGSGTALAFDGIVEFPDLIHLPGFGPISLQLRPGFVRSKGELRARIDVGPIRNPDDPSRIDQIMVDHVITYTQLDLTLVALARLPLFRSFTMQAGVSVSRGIAREQRQLQRAVGPSYLLFQNRQRESVLSEGPVILTPSALVVAVEGGLAYDLPIGARSTLTPEITVSIPINSRTSDGSWRDLTARFGAALRFGLADPPRDTVPVVPHLNDNPPPIVKVTPRLIPSITTQPPVVQVRIDAYDSTEALPLLNQVFFADGSAEIPDRYRRVDRDSIDAFKVALPEESALDVYYNLINIVGKRMADYSDATLLINGYRNGAESDPQLGRRRAERIKAYLTEVWRIAPRRIKVGGGGMPPSPTSEDGREGKEENARVELIPSDPNVTAPVIRQYIEQVATPPEIVFYPNVLAEAGVAAWEIAVDEDGKPWKRFRGSGPVPDSIVWDWRSDGSDLPGLPMSLSYRFSVTDREAQHATTDSVRVDVEYHRSNQTLEHRENDTTISIYSLLLFNFDSPSVSASDQTLLRAIGKNIHAGSVVKVTGYTDSLGEESHNRELANARAQEAARILRSLVPKGVTIAPSSMGGELERFPYDTPEGRSHCRTVIIEVRTPVSGKGS